MMKYKTLALLCSALIVVSCEQGVKVPEEVPVEITEEPELVMPTGNDAEPPADDHDVIDHETASSAQPVAALAIPSACPTPTPHVGHSAEANNLLNYVYPNKADVCAVKSGNASDMTVWSQPLKDGDNVWIPPGIDITYDLDNPIRFGWINAEGNLTWGPGSYDMIVDTLVTMGDLSIGTITNPAQGSITIADNGDLNPTQDVELLSRGVITMGPLSIHGEPKTTMVRLATHAKKGATALTLKTIPTNWRIGDEIVIAGAKTLCPAINGVQTCQPEDETRKIAATSGNTITLDKALSLDHSGPEPALTVHVANLTRSFKIKNENERAPVHQRGHFMVMGQSSVIKYTEFRWIGRTKKSIPTLPASAFSPLLPTSNVKGRYSLHIHKSGADSSAKHFVQGNSVVGSPGWGFVEHDAWVDFDSNVSWNAFGAGFVTEIGNEPGKWTNNIAIRSQGLWPCVSKNFVNDDHWRCGTGFAMARHTIAQNNVCTGSGSGECFGWMTRRDPNVVINIKKEHLPFPEITYNRPDVDVDVPPIIDFKGNEAYASLMGLMVTKSGPTQHHPKRSVITDFTAWNNSKFGIDLTYTGRYNIVRPKLSYINGKMPNRCAFNIGKNTIDLVIIDPVIKNTIAGICNVDGVTSHLSTVPRMMEVINLSCTNCGTPIKGVVKTRTGTFPTTATYTDTKKHIGGKSTRTIAGKITDGLGTFQLGDGTYDPIKYSGPELLNLYRKGHCIAPSGEKAVKMRQVYTGRIADQALYHDTLIFIPAGDSFFNVPSQNTGPC